MNDEPDSAAVKAILKQNGWSEASDGEPIELKEGETKQISDLLAGQELGETIAIPPELLPAPPPEKERVRNLAGGLFSAEEEEAKKDPWSRFVPELGKVEVSEEELTEYTRALLHDTRFTLTIPMYLGDEPMRIGVRSLYISEREVMALAVSRIAEDYPIKTLHNASLVADYFLKLAVLVQITDIDGKSCDPYDARPESGTLPEKSPKVQELVTMARTRFGEMHQAKLKLLIRALHTFETKQQILEDAYHNRDFPRPGGAC